MPGKLLFLSSKNYSFNINDYMTITSDITFLNNIIPYLPYVEYQDDVYILNSNNNLHSVYFKSSNIIIDISNNV